MRKLKKKSRKFCIRGSKKMTTIEQILVSIITALVTAALAYIGFWRQAKIELRKEIRIRSDR
jgi:hypothetical protein